MSSRNRIILWSALKHSGKTTAALRLAQQAHAQGFTVAGLLASSVYRNGELIGFDGLNLQNNKRVRLAERRAKKNKPAGFSFTTAGVKLARSALSPARAKSADLIIVDEFGPLEMVGKGWRENVDLLLTATNALILLVVREELTDRVQKLYSGVPSQKLPATDPKSIDKVIGILKSRRNYSSIGGDTKVTARTVSKDKMIKTSASSVEPLDGMLMIGSAGTNVGKTELACALIRKFSKSRPIVAVKVTTIKAKDGRCPRGGQGCGVCSSLEGDFCITEEVNSNSRKDTSRLLAAGASRVFWLRVMKTHLKEGITALLKVIGSDAILVCESNSLRRVVEPGLFLMVRSRDLKVWKSSAKGVKKYVDRIVVSDGGGFDFDINQIKLSDGKWTITEKATAIIMAGGDSCRMGRNKCMLPIQGQPMIKHICDQLRGSFEQILVSANEPEELAFLGFEVIPDKIPGQGPLMGIASALQASANELNFVVACDIPQIDVAFVRRMLTEANKSEADIIIPTTGDRKYEPLFAIYKRSSLEAINEVLSSGGRKISDVFARPVRNSAVSNPDKSGQKSKISNGARCRVKYVELGDAKWFTNINTTAQYEEFRKKYGD
jgi:molybdopterin-guanine dinucleotide biosynthesis protein A/nucleoside-triphosphatase THEP1